MSTVNDILTAISMRRASAARNENSPRVGERQLWNHHSFSSCFFAAGVDATVGEEIADNGELRKRLRYP